VRKTSHLGANLPDVCRLGLATRGNTHLTAAGVEYAIERGLNYLNWCGKPDGMSEAIAQLGAQRKNVVVDVQFQARTAGKARRELARLLKELRTDYLDIATLYYVESEAEWQEIITEGGAWQALADAKQAGTLRMIGLTSHQRELAAGWAEQPMIGRSGAPTQRYLDMLMIRYNAAHRGAEEDIFPVTEKLGVPVVTFTGLRWRALLQSTPDDPAGFSPPSAADCYRFCISNPAVSVALTAPNDRADLEANLALLEDWRPLDAAAHEAIRSHGDRVRQHAGKFW
jgi:predicted aldo/keto reductase-like oxidoreductase